MSHSVSSGAAEREPESTSWVPVHWCQNGWHNDPGRPDSPCPNCGQTDHMDATTSDWFSADEAVDETAIAPRTPVVHYDPERVTYDGLTLCFQPVNDLVDGDGATTDPAKVTCPSCAAGLVDSQLAEPVGNVFPAGTPMRQHPDGTVEIGSRTKPGTDLTVEDIRNYRAAVGLPPATPAAPEHRTVSVEVLTDELRAAADAAITAEFARYGREPELLPPEARAAVVVRAEGQLREVTDVETDVPQRDPAGALAWLLGQAVGRARNLGAELLMPSPHVLAVLSGQPFGSYTAAVESRWSLVRPGWQVSVETRVAGEQGFTWLLVEGRDECKREGCMVARGSSWACSVVTIRGAGIQHHDAFGPVQVRIPADTEVER